METLTRYPRRVAKLPWAPNEDEKKLLAALRRAAKRKAEAEEAYREALASCDTAGIPIARLAAELDVERKTVYRHLGRRMQ